MAGEAERARGILVGMLMGDRNGGPIQMALELASSLRRLGRFSLNNVRLRYLTRFLREGTDTRPVSARFFELISFGVEPGDAVAQVHREFAGMTAGCNPAHRAAPLAMCSFIADDDLPAGRSGGQTHARIGCGRRALQDTHTRRRLDRNSVRSGFRGQVTVVACINRSHIDASLNPGIRTALFIDCVT